MHVVLKEVMDELPRLLWREDWNSMRIDYHPPHVDRLWLPHGVDHRIYLHRIYPCKPSEALFHPHPWPSAMYVVSGSYFMEVGHSESNEKPAAQMQFILESGSAYSMTDPSTWHTVVPIDRPAWSVMVTGKPWGRTAPGAGKQFEELSLAERETMLKFFRNRFRK